MPVSKKICAQLRNFSKVTNFSHTGAVILDLDGTALHETGGIVHIPESIEQAVAAVHNLGRPVIMNTLRFPLSVIRTIGREWQGISSISIPTILLNGSVLGYVVKTSSGDFSYDEIKSFPLRPEEVDKVIDRISALVQAGAHNLRVFYYPKNWALGEIIWTPDPSTIPRLRERYAASAFQITSIPLKQLAEEMKSLEACMVVLVARPARDGRAVYQHASKTMFINRRGVNKNYGMWHLAKRLIISLRDSVGAGDTVMDNFLASVGLALRVGNMDIPYQGRIGTIDIQNQVELGEVLTEFARMQKEFS